LIKTLESAQHLEEVSFRAENKIISKGEKLAARYMAALLNDRGVPAQLVDLSDIVQKYDLSANRDGFYGELAQGIRLEVLGCGDKLPVVTGYFGNYATGLLHSIGRGYTDLCAALVAVGLGAQELQIWKEIDGIFTGDPRKIPTARLVPSVTPGEAAELSFYGSEVIHPFTMEQVIRERIPIRIKNVMNPRGSGTVIIPDPANTVDPLRPGKLFRTRSSLSTVASQFKPKRPTAVTTKHNIVVINMHSSRRTRAEGFLARIFGILDKWHLSVDLIASSEVHVSMACHISRGLIQSPVVANSGSDTEDDVKLADERLDGAVTDLADLGTVDLAFDMAIVSLVGKDLKNMTGISGRFFSVLGDNNINVSLSLGL
jgi:aspartate kinase